MKSFKNYLAEGISTAGLHKAVILIKSYLHRKLATDLFNFPEAEEYKSNEFGHGYGIRFFIPNGNRSVRINWAAANSIGMTGVSSADVWIDGTPYHVKFDAEQSLVQTLPVIADILSGDAKSGHFLTPPAKVDLHESFDVNLASLLIESIHPEEAYDGIIAMIKDNKFKKYGPGSVYDQYRKTGELIFNALVREFPNYITKKGQGFIWSGQTSDLRELVIAKSKILADLGCTGASVSRGSSSENYTSSARLETLIERLPFTTQLDDLKHLIKMTIGGSSNALFVAGRGGVGKTHTVEEVLNELGLKDGDGYFKNTGTASPAGLYTLLFRYKTGVVLFDDSDDALKDQEARNILKAATDTKKVRKLVWNKRGANVVDPDGDISDEELLDDGKIPRFFEFTGKVIFISNLNMDKLDPDGAIRTRAYMIDVNPTDEEVYEFMEKICDKVPLQAGLSLSKPERLKVIGILKQGKSKQTANLRKLSRGLNMYAAGGANLDEKELVRMISTYA